MLHRQVGDPAAFGEEGGTRQDEERVRLLALHPLERASVLRGVSDLDDMVLETERTRRVRRELHLAQAPGLPGRCHARTAIRRVAGRAPLMISSRFPVSSATESVTPVMLPSGRARLATQPFDRIIDRERHDDGDRPSRCPRRRDRLAADEEHVDAEADQLRRKRGDPCQVSSSETVFDDDVLARYPAVLRQCRHECGMRGAWPLPSSGRQNADSPYLPRWLRLRGERRGEEAEHDGANERAAVHYSIT